MVSLKYGDTLGYFLGDISTEIIDDFLVMQHVQIEEHKTIDFIKSAHHGSKTSINQDLYSNYNIGYVFTSCSTKYKMPNAKFEILLELHGIEHYTTYTNGEIDMILTQETVKIKRFLAP